MDPKVNHYGHDYRKETGTLGETYNILMSSFKVGSQGKDIFIWREGTLGGGVPYVVMLFDLMLFKVRLMALFKILYYLNLIEPSSD